MVNNKPHPEIYLKCLIDIGCKPNETLIFEDSSHGVMAAQDSGCHLFTVKNLSDISYNNISNFMKNLKKDKKQASNSNYWSDPNLNKICLYVTEFVRIILKNIIKIYENKRTYF